MSRTAMRVGWLSAVLVAGGVLGGCGGGDDGKDRVAPDRIAARPPGGAPPLVELPPGVVDACRAMQRQVRWVVLCPSGLPRGARAHTPGIAPLPLGAARRGDVLDFEYNAVSGPEGEVPVSLNRPAYFIHFVVGRATEGTPRGARRARLGGRSGLLAAATRDGSFVEGAYFSNHVRFLWREKGTRYVATLHTFGERPAERLLGRIVASLRPVALLRSPRFTPATGTARLPAGPGASDVAVGQGAAWIAASGDSRAIVRGRVHRVDRLTLRQARVRGIGSISPRVAAGGAGVWATSGRFERGMPPLTSTVVRLSPATGAVLRRLDLGRAESRDLAVSDRAVFVTTTTGKRALLWRIDPVTARPTARVRLPAGAGPVVAAPDGVWVGGVERPVLARFDLRSLRPTGTVRLRRGRSAITGVAAAGGAVWASDASAGTVTRVDTGTLKVAATVDVGAAPYGVAAGRRGVWVAVLGDAVVRRIDPAGNRLAGTLRTGGDPVAIAAAGGRLWVTLNSDGLVLRIPEP
jgi:YVTN family beta-propeller protein